MPKSSGDYGSLCSLVYELDKPVGTSFGDVEFYRDLLAGTSGEILEPAVGTGRILIPLLRAGLRVRGYDSSSSMLAICRDNCAASGLDPVLFEADMVTFKEPAAFAAIAIPTGSFALVTGRERAAQALRNLRESLRPGGRLIVDVEPLEQSTSPGPLKHWWFGDEMLTLSSLPPAQPEEGLVSSWLRYERWRDGRLVETELQHFRLQRYGLDGFAALLRETGFTAITVHADYQVGLPPTPDSQVWTFEATV
ncbi:class I SAM-dependent methyltransferase [Pseudofrankia asymbiotica]|uniref:SAM-dependent methyltransferase n=1 Tax=Pseudofrankia asymbiotica TaxID=1834516 RepID=A0A1V2I4W1_9ACTN|nr:class I SAM-dependent methyltransferase [Pseudofrankia asymbiotica]ONH25991.1 SAM-dependent methyltransferase [Pseudofrankia asymbiotica]